MSTFTNWFAISLLIPTVAVSSYTVYKKVNQKSAYVECWNGGNSILSGVYKNVSANEGLTEYQMDDGRMVEIYNATCVVTEIPKKTEK